MNTTLDRKLLIQDFAENGTSPELSLYLETAFIYASTENSIAVLSDLKDKVSHIFYGGLGDTLGIAAKGTHHCLNTIWEDEILCRIHEKDIERKQLEELCFFEFIRNGAAADEHYMQSTLTMRDSRGKDLTVMHRIFYFLHGRAIRFALCLYTPVQSEQISAIVHSPTGKMISMAGINNSGILSDRELQILSLVERGMSSKEISSQLSISLHTVSRHRQNILARLRASNSAQACRIAKHLKLI